MIHFFKSLTRFELALWSLSVCAITLSAVLSGMPDPLSLSASLVGVTSLILIAKGRVAGQILMVAFSVMYGVSSYFVAYYGEMITYMCMTLPMAVLSAVSWIRHPYRDSGTVEIARPSRRQIAEMLTLSLPVTFGFYFLLRALGNGSLFFSTVSILTSFLAAYLTFLRSRAYALLYAANDVVLIVLWSLAAAHTGEGISYVVCFSVFLVNDLYGFFSWGRMVKAQSSSPDPR